MAFTVHGTIGKVPALVRWDAGALDGDGFAVERVQGQLGRAIGVSPTGPFYRGALGNAQRALLTITSVFDPGPVLTGDPPEPLPVPGVPDGAVT